jgi:hypothetical protein
VLACGILIGLVGPATAGYWVHDSDATKPQFQSMPTCPDGFQPDSLFGVVRDNAGIWEPIYKCIEQADPNAVYQYNTTASPTPTPTLTVKP